MKGSLSFLITGDEEGPALDGTVKVVQALKAEGEIIDHCIVGEPSSSAALGDMIKVGRRGSVNAWIAVEGMQGHVAYPQRAANPVPVLAKLVDRLSGHKLDDGYPEFQPSNLEVVDLTVGNSATNVIPAKASARLNIRFNPNHTGAALVHWLGKACEEANLGFKGRVYLEKTAISGEAFYTEPGAFTDVVAGAVKAATGLRRRSFPPRAAPPTPASSAHYARWSSSASWGPVCTWSTRARRWKRSGRWRRPIAPSSSDISRHFLTPLIPAKAGTQPRLSSPHTNYCPRPSGSPPSRGRAGLGQSG